MENREQKRIEDFKDLKAWQEAHKLAISIYKETRTFPKEETYSLTDQMRRASVSVGSNIAEGFGRHSYKEKANFYRMANGSLTELENQLLLSKDIGYLDERVFGLMQTQLVVAKKLLGGLISKTKSMGSVVLSIILFSILGSLISAPAAHAARFGISLPSNNLGLVGWWTMDGGDTTWTTETAATTLDRSGNGNTGTLTNMNRAIASVSGKLGQALNFDGNDDYVSITDPNLVEGLSTMTVSAWARSDLAFVQYGKGIAAQYRGSGGDAWNLFLSSDDLIRFEINTGVAIGADANSYIPDNKWHHYVGVYNGSNILLYVDNVLQDNQPAQTGNIIASTNPLTIGAYDSGRNWPGAVDDVRIYNRALSAGEIKALYNQGAGTKLTSSPHLSLDVPSNAVIGLVREDCSGYSNCSTSLSAWQTYMLSGGGITWGGCSQGDLTCVDKVAVARIEGVWTSIDSTSVTITGWLTDSDNYITIFTTPEARHNGTWGTGYRRSAMIQNREDYFRLDGVAIKQEAVTSRIFFVASIVGPGEVWISNCFGWMATTTSTDVFDVYAIDNAPFVVKMWNNIGITDSSSSGSEAFYVNDAEATVYLYNNTGIARGGRGFRVDVGRAQIVNNIGVSANSSAFSNGGTIIGSYNNVSDDATADDFGGTGHKINQKVEFKNPSAYDYRLSSSDSAAKGAGMDLSATSTLAFNTDIHGERRLVPWDVGADEVVKSFMAVTPKGVAGEGLNAGLVGHWTFDGPDLLQNVADRSGQGNNGYLSGFTSTSSAQVPGKLGQALKFDGVNDHLKLNSSPISNFSAPNSVCAWVYPQKFGNTTNSTGATIANLYIDASNSVSMFLASTGVVNMVYEAGGSPYGVQIGNIALTLNQWNHFCYTATGSSRVKTYINSVSVNNSANDSVAGIDFNGIGARDVGSGNWKGYLDDVRIYNRALSANEVRQLYNMGR